MRHPGCCAHAQSLPGACMGALGASSAPGARSDPFIARLLEAGLPSAMLQALVGRAQTIVECLLRRPEVAMLTFTGSVEAGRTLAAKAGARRLVLELGGNDALIIMDDADLHDAARQAAEGAFANSGQRCTAVKRILNRPGFGGDEPSIFYDPVATQRPSAPKARGTRRCLSVGPDGALWRQVGRERRAARARRARRPCLQRLARYLRTSRRRRHWGWPRWCGPAGTLSHPAGPTSHDPLDLTGGRCDERTFRMSV